jgi:hypothetical protein
VAWRYLEQRASLRPGERATLFRFWMARDSYQTVSALQSLIFGQAAQHYLTTPGLAFSFFPVAESDFWTPMFTHVELPRLPDADFEVGGRRYGVFAHDWRIIPPLPWLDLLGEREIGNAQAASPPQAPPAAVVLSKPEFAAAVRDALRDFTRPDALRQNPLLRSRLLFERAGLDTKLGERVNILRTLVREAAESLRQSPRDAKLYRALYHAYIDPAPTQEQAAEILDVPFSTYRRHLTAGINQVFEILWQGEIGTEK